MGSLIKSELERWRERVTDPRLQKELCELEEDYSRAEDAFYRHLEFGTGGLRGVLGAGTNRMNIHTVTRATLGIASYIKKCGLARTVAIGYDTRLYSREFAERCACVLASQGISVHIWAEPLPTPMLSYAVRELSASVGIMITASHNPSKYNGYKVYGGDGCQITDNAADNILREIEEHDYFGCGEPSPLETYIEGGEIVWIDNELFCRYIDRVMQTRVRKSEELDLGVRIVYTNLNGTGYRPVLNILEKSGFKNVVTVKEQEAHDGNFPTCPYPNPEIREALTLGINKMTETSADVLIATDPDCDRVGVCCMDGGVSKILTGNEVGILLLDYIASSRLETGSMPSGAACVKTIVTTDLAEKIAKRYGVTVKNVLTGFKYIGETIGALEKEGREDSYVFGFEESCGYLSAPYVRDKDGVFASLLVSEMTAYYKRAGKTLADRLREIYSEHGHSVTELRSYTFEGAEGFEKMKGIMDSFRRSPLAPCQFSSPKTLDYSEGLDGLPKSNVIKFLYDGASLTVRPSGTEPKLKLYAYAEGNSRDEADARAKALLSSAESCFDN